MKQTFTIKYRSIKRPLTRVLLARMLERLAEVLQENPVFVPDPGRGDKPSDWPPRITLFASLHKEEDAESTITIEDFQ